MHCPYFETERCGSCPTIRTPYAEQLAAKQRRAVELLPRTTWLPPVASSEAGFRNKAKMVVAGTTERPTLGILDAEGHGTDLRGCLLHTAGIAASLPTLAAFVTRADLTPYDVPARRGELKHLLLTESPEGALMLRLVLRSQEPVARIRKHLPWLREALPTLRVVSVNLQPEHKAVLEGSQEIMLTEASGLPMRLDVDLALRPQGFFQTNTEIARALYRQAAAWVDELEPTTVWDLYCGSGGFALHMAGPGRHVTGVETSTEAVAAATAQAPPGVTFVTQDATGWVAERSEAPDLVVLNPPRRGIGATLSAWLERSRTPYVLYSSCQVESLARDLATMPSLGPVRGRVFDMFPHTTHVEVMLLLRRRGAAGHRARPPVAPGATHAE